MDTLTENYFMNFAPPPIQPWLHEQFEKAGVKTDILRLDLMHPIIGGNKWMKLKGFFEQLIIKEKSGVLTKGGPWSNHVHACALLCDALGVPCHIWIKGNSRTSTAMLEDAAKNQAEIKFVNRAEFYDEENAIQFAAANHLQYIPMGGAEEAGVNQVTQFIQQLQLPGYDFAICAVGTATTFGGFAFVQNNFTNIIGIDSGTGDDAVRKKIIEWQQQLPDKTLRFVGEYHIGGFARYSPALLKFMNELFASHNIPTDVVYTGKLFYAVLEMAADNYFPPGARLLIVHSGGLQGNRSLLAGTLQF